MTLALANPDQTPAGGHWDPRLGASLSMVQPGEFAVTADRDEAFGTLLGSCIAACICDTRARVGGLNHFLLPDESLADEQPDFKAARFGVHAMEMLINAILKGGGVKTRMKAKLFGGATMTAFGSSSAVGRRNQEFARNFLRREGIEIVASDLGGEHARRVYFRPSTNKVLVQTAAARDARRIHDAEARLRQCQDALTPSGQVDLF